MPTSKQIKGREFETKIAQDLRESGLDKEARRMPASGALEDLKSDIITSLPIHIEAKRQETWDIGAYYNQALSGKKQHEMAIVVMKKNRKEAMALLSWKDLVHLMQLSKESGQFIGEYGFQKRKQLGK